MADGRKCAVAGSFYPASRKVLEKEIDTYFSRTDAIVHTEKIKALLVPHAGTVYSGQVAAWGYRQLPQTPMPHFVIIGPSHHYYIGGLAGSAAASWETPLGNVPQAPPKGCPPQVRIYDEAHAGEHDIEVQLPFLRRRFGNFSFTAFVTGTTEDTGILSEYFMKNYQSSFFIISSDLSHYMADAEARTKDKETITAILDGNQDYILHEDNAACGNTAIGIAMDMAKKNNWKGELVRYDTSAAAFGDMSKVVGYAAIVWYEK